MKDIKYIHVIESTATMTGKKVTELDEKLCGRYPDECFLYNLVDSVEEREDNKLCENDDCGNTENDDDAKFCKACGRRLVEDDVQTISIENISWDGHGTGATFHSVFVKQIAPHIQGRVKAVVLLEGDEKIPPKMFGFVIDDGEFTKCDVHIDLTPSLSLT